MGRARVGGAKTISAAQEAPSRGSANSMNTLSTELAPGLAGHCESQVLTHRLLPTAIGSGNCHYLRSVKKRRLRQTGLEGPSSVDRSRGGVGRRQGEGVLRVT